MITVTGTDPAYVRIETPGENKQKEHTEFSFTIMDWCMESGIAAYVVGTWFEIDYANPVDLGRWVSTWCIIDGESRDLFRLKWA